MKTARPVLAMYRATPEDEALLDRLQHHAFDYFLEHHNPVNGLVADTSRPHSPSSIATVGFALSAYAVGVERGWIIRADAVQRCLAALRFFGTAIKVARPKRRGAMVFITTFCTWTAAPAPGLARYR